MPTAEERLQAILSTPSATPTPEPNSAAQMKLNAILTGEDSELLDDTGFFETLDKYTTRPLLSSAGKTVGIAAKGAGRLLEAGAGIREDVVGTFLNESVRETPFFTIADRALHGMADMLNSVGDKFESAAEAYSPPEEANLITKIEEATFQTLGQIGVTIANPAAGFGMLTAQGAAGIEEKLKEAGLEEEGGADYAVVLGAPLSGLVEKTGLDRILKIMPKEGRNVVLDQLIQASKAGGIEVVEERIEDALQNLSIKLTTDSSYEVDPFRAPGEEDVVAGGAGAASRLILNALLPKRFRMPPDQIKGVSDEPTPPLPKDAPAPMGPFISQERLAARKAAEEAQRRLDTAVAQTPKVDSSVLKGISPDAAFIPIKFFPSEESLFKQSPGMVRTTKGEYITYEEAFRRGELKPGTAHVGIAPGELESRLETAKATLQLIQENPSISSPIDILKAENAVKKIEKQHKQFIQFTDRAQLTLNEWAKNYTPDVAIVLQANNDNGNWGRIGQTKNVGIIKISPTLYRPKAVSVRQVYDTTDRNLATFDDQAAYTTLGHEFGHLIAGQEFAKAPQRVKQALHNEYRSFLRQYKLSQTGREADLSRLTKIQYDRMQPGARALISMAQESKRLVEKGSINYTLSFSEYLAQQFGRMVEGNYKPRDTAKPFFTKVVKKLERFFKKERHSFAPGQTFVAWIDQLSAFNQLKQAEAKKYEEENFQVTPENYHPANLRHAQAQQIEGEIENYAAIHGTQEERIPLRELMRKAEIPLSGDVADSLDGKRDNFSRFKGNVLTLLQIAKRNPHIAGLAKPTRAGRPGYVQLNRMMQNDTNRMLKNADRHVKEWWSVGSREAEKVGRLLTEVDRLSFSQKERIPDTYIKEVLAKEVGLNERGWEVYQLIRDDMVNNLNQIEKALIDRARRLATDDENFTNEKRKIINQVNVLRQRNYFPSTRFGNHVVAVLADEDTEFEGRQVSKGETVLREHYANKKEADTRAAELRKQGMGIVFRDKIDESKNQSFQGIPAPLLEIIRESLDEKGRKELEKALLESAPGRGFVKHLARKRGVAGASQDYMRNYVSYTQSLTRYLNRVVYADQMDHALQDINSSIGDIQLRGGDATRRRMMTENLMEHKDYLFDPGNELNEWSALAFNWYLAGVPKQAVLNFMQVPTVIMPHLAAKYGDVSATKHALHAIRHTFDKKFNPGRLSLELQEALRQGEEDGVLDQSYAHEVAALSQARNLDRLIPGKLLGSEKVAKANSQVSAIGSWLFHKSELFTRRIAFIAAWNAEYEKSKDRYLAYQAARDATQVGAFEFNRYNRPKVMRGKLKPLFIFQTHVQHYLEFMLGGNPGALRAFITLLVLGGIQGIPFVEDLEDIVDWLISKHNKLTGNHSAPPLSKEIVRHNVRDIVETANFDSPGLVTELLLNGAGRYGYGLPWLADKAGVPFPAFDMSASTSLGNIIPGTEALNASSVEDGLAKVTEGVLGPGFGIPLTITKALTDTSADMDKRIQQAAPRFLANPLKALDYYERGAVNRQGVPIVDFDTENPFHQGEIIAQSLGFSPTRVTLENERRWAERQYLLYYQTQRTILGRQLAKAVEAEDAAVISDVLNAVTKYNATVPHPALSIDSEGLVKGVNYQLRRRAMEELGLPTNLRDIPVHVDLEKYFQMELPVEYEAVTE